MNLQPFLRGAVALGCAIAALFFLRFWRDSRDRLLAFFALAFAILAVEYTVLGLVPLSTETQVYVFAVRLLAFGCIVYGIYQKNRG